VSSRALALITMIVAAAVVAVEPRARAGPPSGYRCGEGGTPVAGKGCQCAKDKVAARDADDNAICVRAPGPVHPSGPAPSRKLAQHEARCRAGTAADCTLAAQMYARGDTVTRDAGKALAL